MIHCLVLSFLDCFEGYQNKPQHPMYTTSAMVYGAKKPTVHTMPTSFHCKSQKFSEVRKQSIKTHLIKIVGKWFFLGLPDMVTFPTNVSSSLQSDKNCKCVPHLQAIMLSNFQEERVFQWYFLNETDFLHATSHTKPLKYDSISGTKISIFEKSWGWGCGLKQAPLSF